LINNSPRNVGFCECLRHCNYRVVGEYPAQKCVRLNAKDDNGRPLSGLRSFLFLYRFNVDVLFVEEDVRGAGLGRRLLVEGERPAIALDVKSAKLDTFERQATPLYVKQRHEEYGRIDDCMPGFYLAQMKKALTG